MLQKKIISEIESCGCRISIFPLQHLDQIQKDISSLEEKGLFQGKYFDNSFFKKFDFSSPCKNRELKSIILIASPRFVTDLYFYLEDGLLRTRVPATYTNCWTDRNISEILYNHIKKDELVPVDNDLPLKAIAARSGIAKYGRNSLSFIQGMGSYIMLNAYYSKIEPLDHGLYDYQMMEDCRDCRKCIDSCPNDCIDEKIPLIRIEGCFTFRNEIAKENYNHGKDLFKDTLLGCNICQESCPLNRDYISIREGPLCFDIEETEEIIRNPELDMLPKDTKEKIIDLGIARYYDITRKNLRDILDNRKGNRPNQLLH
jgi:epoxyqueuosine reductase